MVDDFIGRKHGLRKVEYEFPELAPVVHPILEDTYGVILYQEQVMKIASDLAKYSLGVVRQPGAGPCEGSGGDGQAAGALSGRRAREQHFRRPPNTFDLMEKSRGLRLQQVAQRGLRRHLLSDGLREGPLPGRVHGRHHHFEVSNTDKILAHVSTCRDMDIEGAAS